MDAQFRAGRVRRERGAGATARSKDPFVISAPSIRENQVPLPVLFRNEIDRKTSNIIEIYGIFKA